MRRSLLPLLALAAAALAGCGNKGPLSLPATRAPAATPAAPAGAASTGAVPSPGSVQPPAVPRP